MEPDSTVRDEHKNKSGKKWLKRFIKAIACLVLIMVLAILAVLLYFGINLHHKLHHKPDLNELLIRARLAKLPVSIKNLQVETHPYIDDDTDQPILNRGELLVRFKAEPNDIENFLNNSPAIDKNSVRQEGSLPESGQVPTWWSTDESSCRMYVFERDDRAGVGGMVSVYDSSNSVRIWMVYIVDPQLDKMLEDIEDMRDAFDDFLDDMLHEVLDFFEDLLRN